MKVKLISHTPNPEELVAKAGKLCYSEVGVDEISDKLTKEDIEKFVSHITKVGHGSVLEHISFTFAIEGVSRALSLQLVRHRIASYSQQSQRYVSMDSPDFIVPNTINNDSEAYNEFCNITNEIAKSYNKLIDLGIPKEDARSVLPNATETKLVVTMNARALLNFLSLRHCKRTQEEIRILAIKMLRLVKEVAPNVFKYAGASCVSGKCNEGSQTCGKPYDRYM